MLFILKKLCFTKEKKHEYPNRMLHYRNLNIFFLSFTLKFVSKRKIALCWIKTRLKLNYFMEFFIK